MNLLFKSSSSILVLLAAAISSVNANICIDIGNQAANNIIVNNWCTPETSASSTSSHNEERCREVAIRTCQSGTTLRNIIKDICPRDRHYPDRWTPNNNDLFLLGNDCEDTVDSLIDESIGSGPAPPPRTCQNNRQCRRDETCQFRGREARGTCVRRNNNSSSSSYSSSSSSSSSSSDDTTNTCRRNNDCRSGQRCNNAGRCVRNNMRQPRSGQRCTKRSDCGPHRFCGSNGRCQRQDMEEFMEQS